MVKSPRREQKVCAKADKSVLAGHMKVLLSTQGAPCSLPWLLGQNRLPSHQQDDGEDTRVHQGTTLIMITLDCHVIYLAFAITAM